MRERGDERTGRDHEEETKMVAYVRQIARKVRKRYGTQVSEADLIAYGVVGYLEAAARFQEGRGVELRQYVYLRTYGAMIDGVRRWTLQRHVWATQRRSELRATRETKSGRAEGGDGPSRGCASSMATVTTTSLETLRGASADLGSSREPFCAGIQGGRARECASIEEHVDRRRRWGRFLTAARVLSRQERTLLTLYYMEGRSMSKIAEHLGCTKSWICRLHGRALGKIRERLEDMEGKPSGCGTSLKGRNTERVRGSQPSSPPSVSSPPPSVSSASSGVHAEQEGKN